MRISDMIENLLILHAAGLITIYSRIYHEFNAKTSRIPLTPSSTIKFTRQFDIETYIGIKSSRKRCVDKNSYVKVFE